MIILTIVDCFSKCVHYVPLPKLPSAAETGALRVLRVFQLHHQFITFSLKIVAFPLGLRLKDFLQCAVCVDFWTICFGQSFCFLIFPNLHWSTLCSYFQL